MFYQIGIWKKIILSISKMGINIMSSPWGKKNDGEEDFVEECYLTDNSSISRL